MMQLLRGLRPILHDMRLLIETNGVYCDEKHWDQLRNLQDCYIELIITNNSYNKFTYEHISCGGNFTKLMENLN